MNHTTRILLSVAIAIGAGAVSFCQRGEPTDPDRPADTSRGAEQAAAWFSVRNSGGLSFVTRRRPGIDHLIVYAGFGADGVAELEAETMRLADAGFDLISHRRPSAANATGPAGAESTADSGSGNFRLKPEEFREFLELATARPGYRKRILILHGRRLAAGLEFLAGAPRSVAALIVLRPGDAAGDRARLVKAASLLPAELRVLWVSAGGGASREAINANRLKAALRSVRIAPQLESMILPSLAVLPRIATARASRISGFRLRMNEALFYEILLERLAPVWRDATTVFAGGCGATPAYPTGIYIATAKVSAERDRDFCPLFFKRSARALYRAEEIRADGSCAYRRADSRLRIYCSYGRD